MLLDDYLQKKILSITGLEEYEATPGDDKLTYVNDKKEIMRNKLREYGVWYTGDSDELLNFYTRKNNIDYNYEPWYDRNKINYFWAISSTEQDIKRTHSGAPRDIVDTIVNVCGDAKISCTDEYNDILQNIIEDNDLKTSHRQEQMPQTLYEGWGCWKINWDNELSEYPIPVYYRADKVDFVYMMKRIIAVIYKDYYTDGKKKYLVVEIRHNHKGNLHIYKEAFEVHGEDDVVTPVRLNDIKQLKDTEPHIIIENYNKLLSVPTIYYKDVTEGMYGRSIYAGRIDKFDDLDMAMSVRSNTVRTSGTHEYFNTDFLERDPKTGLAKQPKVFDRKFTFVQGAQGSNGETVGEAVQVTQPQVYFDKYDNEVISLYKEILNGLLSPATMGIDVSLKDNAQAQREKEKVTIFTRNGLLKTDEKIWKELCNQLLNAYECMHTGTITVKDYDVTVSYSEFADASYENKLKSLGDALKINAISPKMYMDKMYGDSLSKEDYNAELEYLTQALNPATTDTDNENENVDGTDTVLVENTESN